MTTTTRFATYEEAIACSEEEDGAEEPLTLILQREYIDEDSPGVYEHIRRERVTEWPVEFLRRSRRTARTIPDFLAPDAPANRLDIIRGLARCAAARAASSCSRRRVRSAACDVPPAWSSVARGSTCATIAARAPNHEGTTTHGQ